MEATAASAMPAIPTIKAKRFSARQRHYQTLRAPSAFRRMALAAAPAVAVAGLLPAVAGASPIAGKVRFSTVPSAFPGFAPQIHDYVVRCNDGPVTVKLHTAANWQASIARRPFRSGDFSQRVSMRAGRAFTISARENGHPQLYRYHVRCLPNNFPRYTYVRYGPASLKYFSVDKGDAGGHYAIIFDNHGVPVWWYRGAAYAPRVLPNRVILWWDVNGWTTHRLDGSFTRSFRGVGRTGDSHDIQFGANGAHFVGAYVEQTNRDLRPYGPRDARVENAELQQISRGGKLVWYWKSQQHIAPSETGQRWWPPQQPPDGYDLVHWNSIQPAGGSVIASFRTVDAVYEIDKSTGRIVWKLGGTRTSKSLNVRNDPRRYTFGGQHDARLLSDGTLTVFDNRSFLPDQAAQPRAVRYRIDEKTHTATLLESISDPTVTKSACCGSARRLANGDWLIDWGHNAPIGGYRPNGEPTFRLRFKTKFSYRAEPVPNGVLSPQLLRSAMNTMYATP